MVTVSVRSPSRLRETGEVIRAVFHIIFWSAVLMGATWGRASTPGSRPAPAAAAIDEVAFRDLPPADQRVYRQCVEGLAEAEDVRARTGTWPAIDALARRAIPPFAADPVDPGTTWRLVRDGTVINYVGTAAQRPTFVIVAVEPDPGTPIDPQAMTDEVHHKLADGTLLHVSIWIGSRAITTAVATPAFEDGWRRITMATP